MILTCARCPEGHETTTVLEMLTHLVTQHGIPSNEMAYSQRTGILMHRLRTAQITWCDGDDKDLFYAERLDPKRLHKLGLRGALPPAPTPKPRRGRKQVS